MAESSKKNMLLLSGSKATGGLPEGAKAEFLGWAEPWIKEFFTSEIRQNKPVLVIPYATPDDLTDDAYYQKIKVVFDRLGVPTLCAPKDGRITKELLDQTGGIFVGGGHTYTLLDRLREHGAINVIRNAVNAGLPYMGSSAGTVITCPNLGSCNDLPGQTKKILDLNALGLIGAQINCHYLDASMEPKGHMGETRDERLSYQFCRWNPGEPVLGLYEGQAIRVEGDKTHIWTSANNRGTKPPLFINKGNIDHPNIEKTAIECEVGVPRDVSRIFEVQEEKGQQPPHK